MRETEIGAAVVDALEADGWDVYQEVAVGGGIADVVGVRDGKACIVECKTRLAVSLVEQAIDRTRTAHWVWVAVPKTRRRGWLMGEILRDKGIGLMIVGRDGAFTVTGVTRKSWPKLNRHAHSNAKRLMASLEPEHKAYAKAGERNGKRWTPWTSTCRRALWRVQANGPMTVSALMASIDHHYNSHSAARSSFVQWLRAGSVPGLRIIEGRPLRVEEKS